MQADDAVAVANEFFSSLDNLPNEVVFITTEIKNKDEEIDTIRARMQGRMQNILKHARIPPSTSNKENKSSITPSPSGAGLGSGTTIGPLNAKDQDSMTHISLEWAKIDALCEEKIGLAERLDRLVTRHREKGKDEWRKIAGEEAVEEFEAANPDWTTEGLAALAMAGVGGGLTFGGGVGGSVAGTPGFLTHLNGMLSGGGSAGLLTGSFNGLLPTPGTGNFRSTISGGSIAGGGGGISPLGVDDRAMKKRKANGTAGTDAGGLSGYFSPMGPPPLPGYVLPGGSTLPHGQGHTHATATIHNSTFSAGGYGSPSSASGWTAGQSHRNQLPSSSAGGGGGNKRNRVHLIDADEFYLVESEMELDAGEADGEEGGDDRLYCTCNQKSYGEMIGCDNDECPREWFHLKCVNVTSPVPETWFCSACQITLGLADSSGTRKIKGRKK